MSSVLKKSAEVRTPATMDELVKMTAEDAAIRMYEDMKLMPVKYRTPNNYFVDWFLMGVRWCDCRNKTERRGGAQ